MSGFYPSSQETSHQSRNLPPVKKPPTSQETRFLQETGFLSQ
ncbi:MAG: hypothetical protein P5702_02770 [Limnospira sp. PMC 1291.21]|nr:MULTISPECIES: hypothetical protein [unclassified Limnospira]MDT9188781.1 hypothetical protein [Limnospira sp. PMC 894.15]MDT9284153.1 hypothetical protein [Limnospira sp. PMC 1298.21]MDT9314308.1 hypothetical protein [Limnospira sp. PMC 1306.21]MDT9196969.1 hypothetical protein [Limnospira sp. PMC 1042.18]MDT9196970.1 hypothetical protein [Limnospira sp. PMC 1042.18]